jgi:cell division protein FtsZ
MSEMGKAMMGTGEAEGARRAIDAAEAAISNPLLDEVSLKGARAMLINITAGMDIALFEVDEAVNRVRAEVDPDANVIFGSTFDPTMEGRLRVSVVATGIDAQSNVQTPPARQPTLDVIRGGMESQGARKVAGGGFTQSIGAAAPGWSASTPSFAAQPTAGLAVARNLEPLAMDTGIEMMPQVATDEEIGEAVPSIETASAPATPLAAADQGTGFIPARPQIQPQAQQGPATTFSAQPAAQAPAPEKRRSYSLFERATGAARRAEQASAAAATPQPPVRATPSFGIKAPPRPQPQTQDQGLTAAGQPRLGIDAPPRPKAPASDDDLLEIPTFLRRQAN